MDAITVLTPTGTLGYDFQQQAFDRAMSMSPDVIAVDAGSTDPGPYYLGSGNPLVSDFAITRELTTLIKAGCKAGVPVIVGSVGGAGTNRHVDAVVDLVRSIAQSEHLSFSLAWIYADVERERVRKAIEENEVKRFEASFELTENDIDETIALVAQMGHEPIVQALEQGADVIIAGRCVDDCAIAAYPIWRGADPAQAIHMGKILECGAFAAQPGGMDVMVGSLYRDHFILEPGGENRRATTASVAAHSLYERENPYYQEGPGHAVDLTACEFDQVDERRVRVSGAQIVEAEEYWVKLEGARVSGFRSICIAGVRCPTMIEKIDDLLDHAREETLSFFSENSLQIALHVYGRDGVMRQLEPQCAPNTHELGLVIDCVSCEQDLSLAACHHLSGHLLHVPYDGMFNTAGNLAFPYSPSEINAGTVYEFSAYHLMKTDGPFELFPVHMERV